MKPIEPGCLVMIVHVYERVACLGHAGTAIRRINSGENIREGLIFVARPGSPSPYWVTDIPDPNGKGPAVISEAHLRRIDDYDPTADDIEQEREVEA